MVRRRACAVSNHEAVQINHISSSFETAAMRPPQDEDRLQTIRKKTMAAFLGNLRNVVIAGFVLAALILLLHLKMQGADFNQ